MGGNRTEPARHSSCNARRGLGCLYFLRLSFPPWSGQDSLLQMMRNGEWKRSRLVNGKAGGGGGDGDGVECQRQWEDVLEAGGAMRWKQ